jgi:hypothetical protein
MASGAINDKICEILGEFLETQDVWDLIELTRTYEFEFDDEVEDLIDEAETSCVKFELREEGLLEDTECLNSHSCAEEEEEEPEEYTEEEREEYEEMKKKLDSVLRAEIVKRFRNDDDFRTEFAEEWL